MVEEVNSSCAARFEYIKKLATMNVSLFINRFCCQKVLLTIYYFKIPSELFEEGFVIITDKNVTAESSIPNSKKCSICLPVQC